MLATCVAQDGEDVDVVVKLNGGMDLGRRSATFELVASLIARELGLECPDPLIVRLSPEFVASVANREPSKAETLSRSLGLNFGSKLLREAVIWPEGARIPPVMIPVHW
jgi:hypothetical protein